MRRLFAILAVCVVILAGCRGDSDPTLQGTAGKADHNAADIVFAQGMIPHHQQAIEMSNIALGQGQGGAVKDLAERIKQAQQPEIEQMRGWLSSWDEKAMADHGGSMGMMSDDDLAGLKDASGTDFDRLFLQGMIRHHEGAVDMAKTELAAGQFADAKDLAQRIVETQQAEIAEMRSLLG